jgi:hypothetical protein
VLSCALTDLAQSENGLMRASEVGVQAYREDTAATGIEQVPRNEIEYLNIWHIIADSDLKIVCIRFNAVGKVRGTFVPPTTEPRNPKKYSSTIGYGALLATGGENGGGGGLDGHGFGKTSYATVGGDVSPARQPAGKETERGKGKEEKKKGREKSDKRGPYLCKKSLPSLGIAEGSRTFVSLLGREKEKECAELAKTPGKGKAKGKNKYWMPALASVGTKSNQDRDKSFGMEKGRARQSDKGKARDTSKSALWGLMTRTSDQTMRRREDIDTGMDVGMEKLGEGGVDWGPIYASHFTNSVLICLAYSGLLRILHRIVVSALPVFSTSPASTPIPTPTPFPSPWPTKSTPAQSAWSLPSDDESQEVSYANHHTREPLIHIVPLLTFPCGGASTSARPRCALRAYGAMQSKKNGGGVAEEPRKRRETAGSRSSRKYRRSTAATAASPRKVVRRGMGGWLIVLGSRMSRHKGSVRRRAPKLPLRCNAMLSRRVISSRSYQGSPQRIDVFY